MITFASAALITVWLAPGAFYPSAAIVVPGVEITQGIGDLFASLPQVDASMPDAPDALNDAPVDSPECTIDDLPAIIPSVDVPALETPAVEAMDVPRSGVDDLSAIVTAVDASILEAPPVAPASSAHSLSAVIRKWAHLEAWRAGHVGPPAPADTGLAPRPASLSALYGAFASLQVLDMHSTRRALSQENGHEGNPMMGPIASNKTAFVLTKAASTAAIVWGTEKLRRKNPHAAVVMMAVVTSAMSIVSVHNYAVGR